MAWSSRCRATYLLVKLNAQITIAVSWFDKSKDSLMNQRAIVRRNFRITRVVTVPMVRQPCRIRTAIWRECYYERLYPTAVGGTLADG